MLKFDYQFYRNEDSYLFNTDIIICPKAEKYDFEARRYKQIYPELKMSTIL